MRATVKSFDTSLSIELNEPILSDEHVPKLEKLMSLSDQYELTVLDCSAVESSSERVMQLYEKFAEKLAAQGRKFVLMAGKNILEQMKVRSKLAAAARSVIEFNRLKLRMAEALDGTPEVSLVIFIGALVDAVVQGVGGYAHVKPVPISACDLSRDYSKRVEIAGRIEFSTAQADGQLILCFPEKTFLGVASNIVGENFEKIVPEISDWSGELLNLISSLAQESLGRSGVQMKSSLPAVLSKNMLAQIDWSETKHITLPFKTESGEFYLEIFTHPKLENA